MRRMICGVIRAYQIAISPFLPAACRFTPTCSRYALEAVARFGVLRGGWLAARRILRCHPFGRWGYDPVPEGGERPKHRQSQTAESGAARQRGV